MPNPFVESLQVDGTTMDADIQGRVLAAKTIRRYDAASTLELTLQDDDMLLLTSGLLTRSGKARRRDFDTAAWARFGAMRLKVSVVGDVYYRLAGTSGSYNSEGGRLTLTFEDELAALLRRHKRVLKLGRRTWTRAEFIFQLTRAVKEIPLATFIPEGPIEQKVKGTSKTAREKARRKGFAPGKPLIIKTYTATAAQKRNLEIALTVADEEKAGELATLAMLVAGIGESSFQVIPNQQGSDYGGVFQGKFKGSNPQFKIDDTEGMARCFLRGGKGFQGGGAIKLAASNPDLTPGAIALTVEGSRSNFQSDEQAVGFYDKWATRARDILEAWGGAGELTVVSRRYEFRTKKNENYLAAAMRIASEVKGWRLWIDTNVLFYISDEWLFKRQPVILIKGFRDPAVRSVSFDADVAVPVGEMVVDAGLADWVGPPGSVVEVEKAGPMSGRWLLAVHERDEFAETSTLTLRRPSPKGPEPAPEREKVLLTEGTPASGSVRAQLIQQAEWALKHKGAYHYSQVGPLLASLRSRPVRGHRFDCSWFVTLVYKAAGAPDPNGGNYAAGGWTATLAANGTRTNDPQPGDLAFYGSGPPYTHVAMYVGNGDCIGIGQEVPGIHRHKARYRSDFAGFYTYDLGE